MDPYVKLAYDSLDFYIEKMTSLETYDDYFKDKNNGIIVKIENDGRLKGQSGSIFPTRKDMGKDIVHEAINAGFFSYTYMPINKENLYDHDIKVYEFTDVEQIKYIEDFKDYDGICIIYNNETFLSFRKDYETDIEMFEACIKNANIDSWDIFIIYKFKLDIHTSDE